MRDVWHVLVHICGICHMCMEGMCAPVPNSEARGGHQVCYSLIGEFLTEH